MARVCKKCGEKLFPTDTFCGFCGEPITDVSEGMESFSYTPRSLVGDDALTRSEREKIELAKRRFMQEAAASAPTEKNSKGINEQAAKLSAEKMQEKKAQLLAAKKAEAERKEDERRAAEEEAARLEAERIEAERKEAERRAAEEEAARLEAERIEAERKEAERRAAEEAARLEAERIEAERKEAERRAAEEEAARLEAERIEAERKEAERRAAEEAARLEAEKIEAEIRAAEEEIARFEAMKREAERKAEEAKLETARLEALRLEREKKAEEAYRNPEALEEPAESADYDYGEEEPAEFTDYGCEEEVGVTSDDNQETEAFSDAGDNSSDIEENPEDLAKIWEEAEKRAKAEQREADRLQRKRRLNEKPKNLNRDIILLSIGIVALVILLAFLVRSELKGLKGNDADRNNGVSTEQNSLPVQTPAPGQETGDNQLPSDYGKAWDGSVAAGFSAGEGTESNPYRIMTGSELAYLAAEVNRGVNFSGVYFSLETDLDLSGLEWAPIGYYYQDADRGDLVYSFNGIFSGNGHKIFNYKISDLEVVSQLPNFSSNKVCGLFGTTYGAVISDLIVEQCTVDIRETGQGEIVTGALVGFAYDTEIRNCTVTAEIKAAAVERAVVGIAAGAMSNGKLRDVVTNGNVSVTTDTGINDAGLVSGYAKGTSFENIAAEGKVASVSSGNLYSGGIAGYCAEISVSNAQIHAEISSETLSEEAKLMAGGAIGYYVSGQDSLVNVSGSITAAGTGSVYAGGAYGYTEETVSEQLTADIAMEAAVSGSGASMAAGGVYGCFNQSSLSGTSVMGSITSKAADVNYTGGIAGQGNTGSIKGIAAEVNVSAAAEKEETAVVMCGGAAGYISDVSLDEITVTGNVAVVSQFDGHAGGVSGYINGGAYNKVSASGKITNTSVSGVSSGGFAGYAEGEYTAAECTGTSDRTNDGKNVYDDDFIAIDTNQSED